MEDAKMIIPAPGKMPNIFKTEKKNKGLYPFEGILRYHTYNRLRYSEVYTDILEYIKIYIYIYICTYINI